MMGDRKELFELIGRACDDTLAPHEVARLEKLLRDDKEALQFYLLYLQTDAALHWQCGDMAEHTRSLPAELSSQAAKGGKPDSPYPSRTSLPVLAVLGDLGGFVADHAIFFSLAMILLIGGIIGAVVAPSLFQPAATPPSQVAGNAASSKADAVVVELRGELWSDAGERLATGHHLAAGREVRLASGAASLEFSVGVKAVLQGPARLKLVADKLVQLPCGKLTAKIIRNEARGFKIATPDGAYVDQGTEFGVEVTPRGSSKVHVFHGLVDVELNARDGQPALSPPRLSENAGARIGPDNGGMLLVEDTGECFIRSMDDAGRDEHVVAYWRFEDRPVGILLPDTGGNGLPMCATVDSSFNGNDLYTANSQGQPVFSPDVCAAAVPQTGSPNRSCLDTTQPIADITNPRNVYTHSNFSHAAPLDIQRIAPAEWTIEASVKAAQLLGVPQGFLGRDANFTRLSDKRGPARLTFQINAQNRFAIAFYDADDRLHEAVGEDLPVEAGRWYHLAATSDGRALRLYVDALDGRGYVERAATELPATGSTALGKGQDTAEWTLGRAGNAGDPADWLRFHGWIDEVRISDIARKPNDFLFAPKGVEEGHSPLTTLH